MKDKALYHLLQLRARKLQENISSDDKSRLAEIQKSLRIQRDPGEYILQWRLAGKDYLLKTAGSEFKFYEKGDSAKSVTRRGEELNHRTLNWLAALDLWRQIFTTSGLQKDVLVDDGSLAFGDFVHKKADVRLAINLGLSTLVAAIALPTQPIASAIMILVLTFLMLMLAQSYTLVQLRQQLGLAERVLVAVGGLIPAFLFTNLIGLLCVVFGLYCFSQMERTTKARSVVAIMAGLAFGIGTYVMAGLTLGIFVAMSMLLVVTSLVDRIRVPRMSVLLLLIGFVAGFFLSNVIDPVNLFIQQQLASDMSETVIHNLVLVLSLVLFLSFCLWWIVGTQYYLMPWFTLLAISIAGVVVFIRQNNLEQASLLTFGGFTIFILQKLIRGFVTGKNR